MLAPQLDSSKARPHWDWTPIANSRRNSTHLLRFPRHLVSLPHSLTCFPKSSPSKGLNSNPYQQTCFLGSQTKATDHVTLLVAHRERSDSFIQPSRPSGILARVCLFCSTSLTFPVLSPYTLATLNCSRSPAPPTTAIFPPLWLLPSTCNALSPLMLRGRLQWPLVGQPR